VNPGNGFPFWFYQGSSRFLPAIFYGKKQVPARSGTVSFVPAQGRAAVWLKSISAACSGLNLMRHRDLSAMQ
jgi:hypothetical protein